MELEADVADNLDENSETEKNKAFFTKPCQSNLKNSGFDNDYADRKTWKDKKKNTALCKISFLSFAYLCLTYNAFMLFLILVYSAEVCM